MKTKVSQTSATLQETLIDQHWSMVLSKWTLSLSQYLGGISANLHAIQELGKPAIGVISMHGSGSELQDLDIYMLTLLYVTFFYVSISLHITVTTLLRVACEREITAPTCLNLLWIEKHLPPAQYRT